MNETCSPEQEVPTAQSLIADLTMTAAGILNDHQAEFTVSEDSTQTREVTTPRNGGCALIETLTPEGVRSFKYIRPVIAMPLGKALETTEWQEGSSKVEVTYETETEGTRTGSTSDPHEISYSTQGYLRTQFPLAPEEKPQTPKNAGRLRALLGRLTLRRGQPQS